MKQDFVLSFWTRGYWWTYTETLKVGYSTTGKEADDFVWVGDDITIDYSDWQQITVNMPAEAKYVAIRCISSGRCYLVAIDDIYIGSPENVPGLESRAPARVAGAVLGYEVYLNGEKVKSTTETSHLFEGLANGSYTAGVTARYASGETAMATIGFDILQSSIDGASVSTKLVVSGLRGAIKVSGVADAEVVRVYRPDGTLAATAETASGEASVSVAPGIYLVVVGDTAVSVSVR